MFIDEISIDEALAAETARYEAQTSGDFEALEKIHRVANFRTCEIPQDEPRRADGSHV